MIEAYAFLAVFLLQILAVSVLYPAWFVRASRRQVTSISAERLARMYPATDPSRAREHFLSRYRALNGGIAVLGLLLLGWLFSYTRQADWDDGPVEALVGVYFMVQFLLPLSLVVWLGVRFDKVHKRSLPDVKRKALLQRRRLFDFVSPFAVFLAVLGYFLFAAFVVYIQRDPFPEFHGYLTLGAVTLAFALQAVGVFIALYGRKPNPFESPADRVHTIGLTVKSHVYICIAILVHLSLNFSLVLLNLQRWEPFTLSFFFVICALLCSRSLVAPPRRSAFNEFGSSPVS